MKQQFQKYAPFFQLLFLCFFYAYKAINFPIHDFTNYYFGAQFLANENFNNTIYFPYKFSKAIIAVGNQNIFASYAPNTPFLAVFFLPFTFFSVIKAKIIFNIISSILLVLSCYRLLNFYKINFIYVILIPVLFFIPIKNNLLFGQVYFLLFFLLSEFFIAYEKQQFKKTGFFLSLAILLKVFPILFVLLFLFKKQFKPLFYTLIFGVLLLGISIIFIGFDIWIFFFKSVLPKASNGEIATAFVDNYQSVFMFLKRLLVYDATENQTAFFNNLALFSGFIFSLKVVLIAVGYFFTSKNTNNLVVFSYWVFVSFLISPYGSTYGFILLLFLFFCLLQSSISNIHKIILLLLIFVINTIPASCAANAAFPFSYLKLFTLLLLFAAFLFLFQKNINYKIVVTITVLSLAFFLILKQPKIINFNYLLDKNAPILIYNFELKKNKLTYFYWNEKGENSKSIPFKHTINQKIEVINNQVYYNKKQVTFDTSNKLKPILIDKKTVLYLSDYDRGIGFYTIRKIELN